MATINMLVGQKITLSIVKTKGGIDADVTGVPAWATSDINLTSLAPDPDGLRCLVSAKATGSATITATAQGAGALSANHTVLITANNLADALSLTVEGPPE